MNRFLYISSHRVFQHLFSVLLIFITTGSFSQSLRLKIPHQDYVSSDKNVLLRWSKVNNSFYDLQVDTIPSFSNPMINITGLVNTSHIVTLTVGKKYHWRARSVINSVPGNWTPSRSFDIIRPSQIDSCQLWLRADSGVVLNGLTVESWLDFSPNQRVVTQTASASQPLFQSAGMNGNPCLQFDGINDRFSISNFNYQSENVGFLVAKRTGLPELAAVVFAQSLRFDFATLFTRVDFGGAPGEILLPGFTLDTMSVITLERRFGNCRHYKNVTQLGATWNGILTSMGTSNMFIGSTHLNNFWFNGQISELIIFNQLITNNQRLLIQRYLMDKHSPRLSLPNDTVFNSFCPFPIDAGSNFMTYQWSTGATTPSILATQSGTYKVTVTDFFGRQFSDSLMVTFPQPNEIQPASLCAGNQLVWNTGLSSGFNHQWSNGQTGSSISITQTGNYSVTITDGLGCAYTSPIIPIVIDQFPITATLGPDTTICAGNIIQLLQGFSPGEQYLWSTGSNQPQIIINSSGIYWVEVINSNNCIARDTIVVTVNGIAPTVNFISPSVCEGNSISLNPTVSAAPGDQIVAYSWALGDGNISSLMSPSHLYSDTGTYQVVLTVETQQGCFNSHQSTATVLAFPKASFVALNSCSNQATQFINTSQAFNGLIAGSQWSFSDPLSGTLAFSSLFSPSNIYNSSGTSTVRLIVQNQLVCADTVEQTITVKPSPVADWVEQKVCEGDTTRLFDSSFIPFPWNVLSREWIFPNGTSSTGLSAAYYFGNAGSYPVTYTILASNGCRDTLQRNVTIHPIPAIDIVTINPCTNGSVSLFNNATCVNCNSLWSIQNLATSTENPFVISINESGSYPVNYQVTTDKNCTQSTTFNLQINQPPVSSFIASESISAPLSDISFTNTSSGANEYSWDFGNASGSTLSNPVVSYSDTGAFTVSLVAMDAFGCSDTSQQRIQIYPTRTDLAILSLNYTIDSAGFISPEIQFINFGTKTIRRFFIEIENTGDNKAREVWEGSLIFGQKVNYRLKSSFKSNLSDGSDYFCVKLSLTDGQIDEDLSNNTACIELKDEPFILSNPFPIPTDYMLFVPIISKFSDRLTLEIIDGKGQVVQREDWLISEGFSRIQINVAVLNSGLYQLRAIFRDKIQSRKFLITRP
jgi:PKD repeat protein